MQFCAGRRRGDVFRVQKIAEDFIPKHWTTGVFHIILSLKNFTKKDIGGYFDDQYVIVILLFNSHVVIY